MNHQVSLPPAATLTFQLVFGLLFGFLCFFLALPIVVVGQVWLEEILVKDIMGSGTRQSLSDEQQTPRTILASERV